jgi:hypothetical protein
MNETEGLPSLTVPTIQPKQQRLSADRQLSDTFLRRKHT